MERKIVQTGGSLAVTLPAEVVEAPGLKKGQEVDVDVHPATGAVVIRPGVKSFEDGKATKRFKALSTPLLDRSARALLPANSQSDELPVDWPRSSSFTRSSVGGASAVPPESATGGA